MAHATAWLCRVSPSLRQPRADVGLHRVDAQVELVGDLPVAEPLGDAPGYVGLAHREPGVLPSHAVVGEVYAARPWCTARTTATKFLHGGAHRHADDRAAGARARPEADHVIDHDIASGPDGRADDDLVVLSGEHRGDATTDELLGADHGDTLGGRNHAHHYEERRPGRSTPVTGPVARTRASQGKRRDALASPPRLQEEPPDGGLRLRRPSPVRRTSGERAASRPASRRRWRRRGGTRRRTT
ncbi:hypothetical protein SAMN05216561_12515 [Nocardioides psychrotolerans]|uniref:Uncharacterized protein n=1 Tax=Nocardioides psychrotolerans TaxID=1005945 RepID=A0A1I3QEV5_9ACTN|nr:hypothetical protein SAMN05216561_12515 [Nocardioides psychrotolerans]